MINSSKPLLFFGNERLVSGLKSTTAPVLRALIEQGYPIAAVISHHSDGKSRNNRELEVAQVAAEYNIPVLLPNRPSDIHDEIVAYGADAAILVAYGRIIPQSIIDIFPKGIINIHPSLLPRYRGPTPIESAIINGDTQTGVSIMQLSAGMDEGPVYAQATTVLHGNETKFELYETLSTLSVELLISKLPSILDGTLQPKVQIDTDATYCKLLSKADSSLDVTTTTAEEADRRVRAHLGFPKTKIKLLDHEIIITKAHVTSEQKTPLDIECRDGAYLTIDELIAPSGRLMDGKAFLRGYAAA
jgi:methionyl-tRNA formyltransferase